MAHHNVSFEMSNKLNLFSHPPSISREHRDQLHGHKAVLVWFTGLSGSGKSSLAHAVEEKLHQTGCHTVVLDGDNIRHGLCSDLGFSDEDRKENNRRIGELAKLFVQSGTLTLAAFISPFRAEREKTKALFPEGDFIEIYVDCDIDVCAARDTNGLYKRAYAGEIEDFTGISSPYEKPLAPDLAVKTDKSSLDKCVAEVLQLLRERGVIHDQAEGVLFSAES